MQSKVFHLFPESPAVHTCNSTRKGDWIVFSCEQCEGYERRLNWKTGEMKVKTGGSTAQHSGVHIPAGVNPALMNLS